MRLRYRSPTRKRGVRKRIIPVPAHLGGTVIPGKHPVLPTDRLVLRTRRPVLPRRKMASYRCRSTISEIHLTLRHCQKVVYLPHPPLSCFNALIWRRGSILRRCSAVFRQCGPLLQRGGPAGNRRWMRIRRSIPHPCRSGHAFCRRRIRFV